MIKLTKTAILTNYQVPNGLKEYNCNFCHLRIEFFEKLLSFSARSPLLFSRLLAFLFVNFFCERTSERIRRIVFFTKSSSFSQMGNSYRSLDPGVANQTNLLDPISWPSIHKTISSFQTSTTTQ